MERRALLDDLALGRAVAADGVVRTDDRERIVRIALEERRRESEWLRRNGRPSRVLEVLPDGFGFEWTELALQEKQASGQQGLIFALGFILLFLGWWETRKAKKKEIRHWPHSVRAPVRKEAA